MRFLTTEKGQWSDMRPKAQLKKKIALAKMRSTNFSIVLIITMLELGAYFECLIRKIVLYETNKSLTEQADDSQHI